MIDHNLKPPMLYLKHTQKHQASNQTHEFLLNRNMKTLPTQSYNCENQRRALFLQLFALYQIPSISPKFLISKSFPLNVFSIPLNAYLLTWCAISSPTKHRTWLSSASASCHLQSILGAHTNIFAPPGNSLSFYTRFCYPHKKTSAKWNILVDIQYQPHSQSFPLRLFQPSWTLTQKLPHNETAS